MVTQKALAHNVLSTNHQKVILQIDQQPNVIDVKHKAGTHIPTEIVYEESPVGDSNANGSIERANQTIQGQIRAIKGYTERQIGATIGLDSSVLKWLVRHAEWTLATFHFGGDGMTTHHAPEANHSINRLQHSVNKSYSSQTRPRDHSRNSL